MLSQERLLLWALNPDIFLFCAKRRLLADGGLVLLFI